MSTFSQFAGGGGGIKSIQRGVAFSSYDGYTPQITNVTISSVNTAKTELRLLGWRWQNESVYINVEPLIELVNSTTIRITRASGNHAGVYVSWELTEWN